MMKIPMLAAAGLSVLLSFNAAGAASGDAATPAQRPLIGGHGDDVDAFIAQHDSNGDGRVDWAEFERFRRERFDATDENGDGVVDVEEYVQEFDDRFRQSLENGRAAQVEQTHTRFRSLDANGDGFVSRAEFDSSGERMFSRYLELPDEVDRAGAGQPAARPQRSPLSMPTSHTRQGMLALYDTNGDGKVDRAEFDAARAEQFARIDANGDGRLDSDEYLAEYEDRLDRRIATLGDGSDRQTRVRFGALDTDKDGRMTWEEYMVSGRRIFDRVDRNGDGIVDQADARLPAPERTRRAATGNAGN